MRNIEAPKALSQFRAWGIAPGDQIAAEDSAERAVSIQRLFSILNAIVAQVNRALSVDRYAFGADHRLKAWLPAQFVSAPSVGYCCSLKLKNFCA
jgi:hypothetical protein